MCCGLSLQVNLRHLREHVALLAARLRQHKADVNLAKELQDLEPQVSQLGFAGFTYYCMLVSAFAITGAVAGNWQRQSRSGCIWLEDMLLGFVKVP